MATELATAYVSLVAETSKLEAGVKSALSGVGKQAETAGQEMGSKLARTASKALKDGWRPDQDIMAGIPNTKLDRIGAHIGQVIGKGIAGGIKAQQIGKEFGNSFAQGAGSVGLGSVVSRWRSDLKDQPHKLGYLAGKGISAGLQVGLAGATAIVGTALKTGFDRLVTLDTAQNKLRAILRTQGKSGDFDKINKAVQKSVDKTPFSLDQAFGTAVQAIGAGSRDIERFMKNVADAAGFAGTDLDRMGLIFNQVLAKGKLTGEETMQLMEAGLPARSWIQKSYNLTNEQFDDMAEKGQVTLDMLQRAIEDNAPGMAQALGNTLQGSIDNMQTALARTGANFLAAIFGGPTGDATEGLKSAVQRITEMLQNLNAWVIAHKDDIRDFFEGAKTAAGKVVEVLGSIADLLREHPGLIEAAVIAFAGFKTIQGISAVATALGAVNTALVAMPAATSAAIAGLAGVSAAAAAAVGLYLLLKDDPNLGNRGTIGNGGGLTTPLGGFNPAGPFGPFGNPWAGMDNPGGVSSSVGGNAANSILGNMAAGGGASGSAAGNSAAAILGGMAGMSGGNVSAVPLVPGQWGSLDAIAKSNFGMNMTSGFRDPNGPPAGAAGVPANQSYHGSGRAHDFSGTPEEMARFAGFMASTYGGQLKELIYGGPGWDPARNILNGSPHGYGEVTLQDHGLNNPQNAHVHVAFASGGGVSGPGTRTSDSIAAWLSNGEHVLSAADVAAMGGQSGVYAFRNALHRAGGGEIFKMAEVIDSGKHKVGSGNSGTYKKPTDIKDLPPIFGDTGPGIITGDSPMPRGPQYDNGWFFPWWWGFTGGNKLDPLTPNGKIRKNLEMFGVHLAEGGDPQQELLKQLGTEHAGTGAPPGSPVDPTTMLHGAASGAAPGPADPNQSQAQQPNYGMDFVRSLGFIPASAGSTSVAGTSSLAGFINMGNSVVSGVIDTGVNLANQAVSAAVAAGVAGGSFGGAAAAAPLAQMAASYGIQLAGNQAKRISQYWFGLAGIGADALIEQLSPFGTPRWLGYDYTNFAPQIGLQQAALSTVEKMGSDAIGKAFPAGQQAAPTPNPAGPVTPATMPGASAPITEPPPGPTPPPSGPSSTSPMDMLPNLFGYDQGGMLKPGGIGINMTNRPEPVLTPQQWDAIAASSSEPNRSAPLVQNLYAQDMQDAIRKLEQVKRRDMMQYAGRP